MDNLKKLSDYRVNPATKRETILDKILKIFKIIFIITLIGFLLFFGYLLKTDNISGIIKSYFNQTTNLNNQNSFNPNITVPIEDTNHNYIYNNYTIVIINTNSS